MKITTEVGKVVDAVIVNHAARATKYVSENMIVRATVRRFRGKICKGNQEIVLCIGKPNHRERQFIKRCKKAGEPFPIKKIQLQFPKAPR